MSPHGVICRLGDLARSRPVDELVFEEAGELVVDGVLVLVEGHQPGDDQLSDRVQEPLLTDIRRIGVKPAEQEAEIPATTPLIVSQ